MSYTLNYTGPEIDDILARAVPGGALDTAIAAKQDALTFDAVPTEGSTNPAESGGIYDAMQAGGATALAAFATDSVTPGDIVSFSDGADSIPVKSFVGSIMPVQNLNGYDNPWPAGGNKNLLTDELQSASPSALGVTLSVSGGKFVLNGTGTGNGGRTTLKTKAFTLPAGTYTLSADNTSNAFAAFITDATTGTNYVGVTQSASSASFTLSADTSVYLGINVSAVTYDNFTLGLQVESGSTVTEWSPYSNICPISGWTGANIYRTGGDIASEFEQGGFTAEGLNTEATSRLRSIGYYPVEAGKTYVITATPTQAAVLQGSVSYYTKDDYTTPRTDNNGWNYFPCVFTPPSGTKFVRVLFRKMSNANIVPSQVTNTLFGSTITLTFGSTVYAGTITALGGGKWSIQPTHAMVDLGTLAYAYRSSKNCFDVTVPNMVDGVAGTVADILCSTYPATTSLSYSNWQNAQDKSIFVSSSESSKIVIRDTAYTSAADFVAAVTGQTLLYPLATLPDPIIVSGDDLATLLGANTVWTDCGSVTGLTYRADTALYIQKLLNGGGSLSLSMAAPAPSLSLGGVGVLAEPETEEPEQTEEE